MTTYDVTANSSHIRITFRPAGREWDGRVVGYPPMISLSSPTSGSPKHIRGMTVVFSKDIVELLAEPSTKDDGSFIY